MCKVLTIITKKVCMNNRRTTFILKSSFFDNSQYFPIQWKRTFIRKILSLAAVVEGVPTKASDKALHSLFINALFNAIFNRSHSVFQKDPDSFKETFIHSVVFNRLFSALYSTPFSLAFSSLVLFCSLDLKHGSRFVPFLVFLEPDRTSDFCFWVVFVLESFLAVVNYVVAAVHYTGFLINYDFTNWHCDQF